MDNVEHPSWQAQLRGKKKWNLQPPPECYYECENVQIVVEPGEISKHFRKDICYETIFKWLFKSFKNANNFFFFLEHSKVERSLDFVLLINIYLNYITQLPIESGS